MDMNGSDRVVKPRPGFCGGRMEILLRILAPLVSYGYPACANNSLKTIQHIDQPNTCYYIGRICARIGRCGRSTGHDEQR